MNKIQGIIEDCLNYIETHLREKIVLDNIANCIGVSKYHLHRIFKSLTGESIIGYSVSRKLAESMNEILQTKMKILDVALEYGFEHEQSYIRAFKKEYGLTPAKARITNGIFPIKERISLQEITPFGDAVIYRPFFNVRPALYLTGIEYHVPLNTDDMAANTVGLDFFYNRKPQIENQVRPDVYYAFVDWGHLHEGYTVYCPSAEVSRVESIPDGMTGRLIPAHKYVVFRFIGYFHPEQINVTHFNDLLEYMYSKWVFQSGYEFAAQYRFEYIDSSIAKDDYCELDIYQPVKNRE